MDKYEYKVRADEIKELIARGEYVQAAEIADTIDWRRVKSVMMLCTISDLYKINRRYEDARDMLLLAYERRPGGRTICYSLCELSIKTEEFVQAVEYYKEYVQVAPKDPGRYILQYKLYEAQDVSLEERIEVLEELKKRDYREKWAYELAYLYHRVGLATRCVEECDELILWVGEGKYVIKAMELKMLHQPLSPEQQEIYDHRYEQRTMETVAEPSHDNAAETRENTEEKISGVTPGADESLPESEQKPYSEPIYEQSDDALGDTKIYEPIRADEPEPDREEFDIQVKPMDMGKYNTMNLQAEIAAGVLEVLGNGDEAQETDPVIKSIMAPMMETDTESLDYPEIDEVDENDLEDTGPEEMEHSEVFFGGTGEIGDIREVGEIMPEADDEKPHEQAAVKEEVPEEKGTAEDKDTTAEAVMAQLKFEALREAADAAMNVQPPKEMAQVLSQESDGQISLVMPESRSIEEQITGQMDIEDILAEWERKKRENAEKGEEEVRRHVLEQTGDMFTEFEASIRDGLLEKLEGDAGADNDGNADNIEETEQDISETDDTVSDIAENNTDEQCEAVEQSAAQPEEAEVQIERDRAAVRSLTRDEKELFAPFIQSRHAREQLVNVIDNVSMAAYTGNIILTGEEGTDTMTLAKNIVREIKSADSNFSGRIAKISGQALNNKNVADTVEQLANGALIVQKASGMSDDTVKSLYQSLQQEKHGIIVIIEDTQRLMDKLLTRHEMLLTSFTGRMDVEALNNDTLVEFGRQYAHEREYFIDDFGILALHTRIEERQTMEHAVTVMDVKELVDRAIKHADKKTLGHFFDILFAKRYDDEDMIILGEKDFS
ncbi:MAG: hypothetical protein LUG83_08200 [Lachnospiraceae bacterium]|nr:hypothetical protein [Lachnospiraceae bacterium]